MQLSN
jgi:hypothetical protein